MSGQLKPTPESQETVGEAIPEHGLEWIAEMVVNHYDRIGQGIETKPHEAIADMLVEAYERGKREGEWRKLWLEAAALEHKAVKRGNRLAEAIKGLLDALPSSTTHPAIATARAALREAGVES